MKSSKQNARPSQARIVRAIASSTAIETGQSVKVLELKLTVGIRKFRHLTLAP